MSKVYECDMCGRFDFKPDDLKTIVAIKHQNEDDFLAKYKYKQDVIIGDICPVCLEKLNNIIKNIIYCKRDDVIEVNACITKKNADKTRQVLVDNGVLESETDVVLQAIGATLLNTELEDIIWE